MRERPMLRILMVCNCLLFVFLGYTTVPTQGIKWLALSRSTLSWNVSSHCLRSRRHQELVAAQAKLCKRHLEVMPHVVAAASQTIASCQEAFADRRWNCSAVNLAPNFTPDLTTGTREQAFVYALASAAVAYTVARACSAGLLYYCGCGQLPLEPPNGDFKWGGCGDNIRYGLKFSKSFTDAIWKNKKHRGTLRAAIGRHNNQAGRKAVEYIVQKQCKCHGVSGSCNIKTCWRALLPLSEVSAKLKRKYAVASEVVSRQMATRRQLQPASPQMGMFKEDDLVFITKSPDYCVREPRVGSLGTKGRLCNATSDGHGGCDSMCCGRGYQTYVVEKIERCHCKYYWCCYVKCKTCKTLQNVHRCR